MHLAGKAWHHLDDDREGDYSALPSPDKMPLKVLCPVLGSLERQLWTYWTRPREWPLRWVKGLEHLSQESEQEVGLLILGEILTSLGGEKKTDILSVHQKFHFNVRKKKCVGVFCLFVVFYKP